MNRQPWRGWIRREDLSPEVLEKIDRYRERFSFHFRAAYGSGRYMKARELALAEVPLTEKEQLFESNLEPFFPELAAYRQEEPEKPKRPPFDARAFMISRGIDPDEDITLNVSNSDDGDPDVRIWGTEYRNSRTGEVRFEETHRERFYRGKGWVRIEAEPTVAQLERDDSSC